MKSKHLKNTWLLTALAVLCFFADSVLSQPTYQRPVGTRPRSMGEAFLAVADDGNAIFWNPAGLAQLERIQVSFAYANLFGLDIHDYYASFASRAYFIPPLADYLSFGIGWSGFQTKDDELEVSQDQFNFSLALRAPTSDWFVFKYLGPFLKPLSLGVTAKYLQQTGSLYGNNNYNREGDAKGWGGGWKNLIRDFGVLYNVGALPHVLNGLHVGFVIHDLEGTEIRHDSGTGEKILPQKLRWGLSYRPVVEWKGPITISDPVVAIDVDDRVHVGLEFWLSRMLAIRAGFQKDRHTDEGPTLSFGLGFKAQLRTAPGLNADYSFTDSPSLPNTPAQFGGTLIFKNNPRLIRIEEAHIEDVFASLYLHYGEHGAKVGTVKLKNYSEHEALQARVTFTASQYMLPQQPDTVVIEPGQTHDFDLRAVFEPEILEAREGRLTGEVRVAYEYQNAEHASRAAVDFAIYSQNYLTWDDPCKAAAFVTSNDPAVAEFVEAVRSIKIDSTKATWFTRYERADAMKLYHALQAYNIEYRLDEKTPFPSLRGASYRRDKITYPATFLRREKRFGDCDDLAVLYASLLQNAGFATALVSVPGHLLMMFDTEIDTAQHRTLPLPPKLFVPYKGTLWIPVETTMIPKANFMEAWQAAVDSFEIAENWEIFEVAACQASYRPPRLPSAEGLKLSVPDFSYRMEKNLLAVEAVKRGYFQSFEDSLNTGLAGSGAEEIKLRNRFGVILAENGEYEQALGEFELIRRRDRTFAPAWNNRGNVEFMLGRFPQALAFYDSALAHNPFSKGTYLNVAILYQIMISGAPRDSAIYYQNKSDAAMLKAAQYLEGDSLAAHALLRLTEERQEGKASNWFMKRVRELRKYVDTAFRRYAQKKEIRGVTLDQHGPKGRNEVDADRGMALYWSF